MYVFLEKKIPAYIVQSWACLQIRDNFPYISETQARFRIRRHVLVELLVLKSLQEVFHSRQSLNESPSADALIARLLYGPATLQGSH